jgi:dipeptidyl aminopeptidase/acylaminoacyl peptidase
MSAVREEVSLYTFAELFTNSNLAGFSFSSDEKSILFTADTSGVRNVFAVPVSGGEAAQLTHSVDDNIQSVSYFPHDSRVLYMRDRGNAENAVLCVREPDGREVLLTPAGSVQARFAGWSNDGSAFYCAINSRDQRFFDLYKIDSQTYERVLLFEDTTGYAISSISKDEKYVLLLKIHGRSDSDLYLYNLQTRELRRVTPHHGYVFNSSAVFDCDSRLYYVTDKGHEFTYVVRHNLNTGSVECFHREAGDILQISFSQTCRYLLVVVNENNRKATRIYDRATGCEVCLPQLPEGEITHALISRSERLMAFYAGDDRCPNTLSIYDFNTRRARKLVGGLSAAINPQHLVKAEALSYRSFDGLEIPCLLWKPHEASKDRKVPALIWAHGGPGGQTTRKYSARIQYLANNGYAVLAVNYRGSGGYGKTFLAADTGKHGREPVWDCVEAKKLLQSLGYVDTRRIGIIGSSLGGYIVLAALAFCPDEFNVGVDICGVSNWLSMLESLPPYWASISGNILYEKLGTPATEQDRLKTMSPIFRVREITKPLLVIQGAKDPRVKRSQSDAIVEAIRKGNGIVEYLLLDDEAHVIRKRSNAVLVYETILEFLDRHLKRDVD